MCTKIYRAPLLSVQNVDICQCRNLIKDNLNKKVNICSKYVSNQQICPSPPLHDKLYCDLLEVFKRLLPCFKNQPRTQNKCVPLSFGNNSSPTSENIKKLAVENMSDKREIKIGAISNNDTSSNLKTEFSSNTSTPSFPVGYKEVFTLKMLFFKLLN